MKLFTEADRAFFSEKGISPQEVFAQIETFREGIPPVHLSKAAVIGDGIQRLSAEEQQRLQKHYRAYSQGKQIAKFTPASGAASRMFKALFAFLEAFKPGKHSLEAFLSDEKNEAIRTFYEGIEKFPFYEFVRSRLGVGPEKGGEFLYAFVEELLSEGGLNYGFYPKGLLPFHKYGEHLATPLEEHLKEGAAYARSADRAHLHFTISFQHRAMFESEYEKVLDRISGQTGCAFEVGYSYQKGATDTLAVTPDNEPFRDREGRLLFRPGGHGALLENLNEQEADVLFIKNIDNVVPERSLEEILAWKEVLGGYLLEVQEEAFRYSRMLEEGALDHDLLKRVREFLEGRLNVRMPQAYTGYSLEEKLAVLKDKLFRPIRICGMVRNEGDPGGGPFWIRDANGNESLQIVESAQVDGTDAHQLEIFKKATHFNPVDLVCGVKDAYGTKFNLMNFRDPKQGFITDKTYEGRPLKALELPGLWNGGMAYWNTVFIEVPIATFNPVKTVNDLLKPAHQAVGG
ncbi:MAG: DUF4301 family protein [Robiginitalea sp.]|nr:DUF4301 family protein [Robiginitalea sp.]